MAPSAPSEITYNDLPTLEVNFLSPHVLSVAINRPTKLNSMDKQFWLDCRVCFQRAGSDPRVRAIVLSANGRMFSAGLDLSDSILDTMKDSRTDTARTAFVLRKEILALQSSFDEIERCNKPVICVSHGASVGAGVDLAAACDIRYVTKDAYFTIKEVDVGIAADVGTLARMPRAIGNDSVWVFLAVVFPFVTETCSFNRFRELAYTARNFGAAEAKEIGFVGRIFDDKDAAMKGALETAELIASKSPVGVQGTKNVLLYSWVAVLLDLPG